MNSEKRRQKVEHVAKFEIAPNWHIFVFIFGQEIKEKVEKQCHGEYHARNTCPLNKMIRFKIESNTHITTYRNR